MNKFMNNLIDETNYAYTENGAITHYTTKSDLLDFFAMGGSMRNRSEDDIILMFRKAYAENPLYALRCLFYLRDCRGGAGERRLFRICIHDLANTNPDVVKRNIENIPIFGRYDDLYALENTPLEKDMFFFIKKQLVLDIQSQTPSLLAKWLPSCNTSSKETCRLGKKTRIALDLTAKEYRKILSTLRKRINIVERLISANQWDKIIYDKIPSKAGLIYKNAFARHDYNRYAEFAKSKEIKVNAATLNPVDIARQIFHYGGWTLNTPTDIERAMWQKYWDNLKDYYNGREERGIAVVDVSGSMEGTPMNAAISMGAYIAERGKGPFANHFITFSSYPELVKFDGIDIYDKFQRARKADWGGSTNIEATFNSLLRTAVENHCTQDEMPQAIYVFSDMEFDHCVTSNELNDKWGCCLSKDKIETLFDTIKKKWNSYGYKMPRLIFWNLDCRHQNIPIIGDGISYVSGFSMAALEGVLSGKDGYDLMMEMLDKEKYSVIK